MAREEAKATRFGNLDTSSRACHPSAQKAEAGGLRVGDQPTLLQIEVQESIGYQMRPASKIKKRGTADVAQLVQRSPSAQEALNSIPSTA